MAFRKHSGRWAVHRALPALVLASMVTLAASAAPAAPAAASPTAPAQEAPPAGTGTTTSLVPSTTVTTGTSTATTTTAVPGDEEAAAATTTSTTATAPPGGAAAPSSPPPAAPTQSPDAAERAAALATVRAFGHQPYDDAVFMAAVEAAARRTAGCTTLSNARLAGMMLAITFTEAGPLASGVVAPSPMTLSRWDGSAALYSLGRTDTPYRTAFWHPGIGLWQFDHPWDNTAAERIDTAQSAQLAAQVIAGRFCSWTSATGFTQFAWSVRPWHGCDTTVPGEACRAIFLDHYRANGAGVDDDTLVGFTLQDGVTRLGGARFRTCQLVGQTTTVRCLYVDPGVAQGNRNWTAPTFSTNPLSSPFYVIRVGDTERRYWLSEDTGYGPDITASTDVGTDPRLTMSWATGDRMCDLSTLHGACELRAPAWKRWRYDSVGGTYQPVVGDFDGNGRSDVFWYAPGTGADGLWLWRDGAAPVKLNQAVNGTYEPLVGDYTGDGRDDILWYAAGPAPDGLWVSTGPGTWASSTVAVDGDYDPLVADFGGDGRDDVLWYAPVGSATSPEQLWLGGPAGFTTSARTVADGFEPFTGDFNGDGRGDVFWYAPGAGADAVWFGRPGGSFISSGRSVGGVYEPLVGDYDGNGLDDVIWYAPGFDADFLWLSQPAAAAQTRALTVNGTYQPVVGDISGNGRADVVWYAPGTTADSVWLGGSGGAFTSDGDVMLDNSYVPLVGAFDAAAGRDIFWYGSGSVTDGLWYD